MVGELLNQNPGSFVFSDLLVPCVRRKMRRILRAGRQTIARLTVQPGNGLVHCFGEQLYQPTVPVRLMLL